MRLVFRIIGNLFRVLFAPFRLALRRAVRPRGPWIELKLPSKLNELPSSEVWWRRVVMPEPHHDNLALSDIRELIERLAKDPNVVGLIVHVPPQATGMTTSAALRDALLSLRNRGKKVTAFLPHGGGPKELLIATACDRIVMTPRAQLELLGFASQGQYLKHLLERLGLEVEVTATGAFKSAADRLSRDNMGDGEREQLTAILQALHAALIDALMARPGVERTQVDAWFVHGLLGAEFARQEKLIDDVGYEDELLAMHISGPEPERAVVRATHYLKFHRATWLTPVRTAPYIAVLPVKGAIAMDRGVLGGAGAVLQPLVDQIRALADDKHVLAVVLHVNSPGGSALASDLLHRELVKLQEKKPLVACFGDVAASGGYYIAMAAQHVTAHALTITGSIGVIAVKLVAGQLLDRIGVRTDVVRTAPHADMFSPTRRSSDTERALFRREIDNFYTAFLDIVARGRSRTRESVAPFAEGRVWTGLDAQAHGLVDSLGDLQHAVEHARTAITGIDDGLRARLRARVRRAERGMPEGLPWQLAAKGLDRASASLLQAASGATADRVWFLSAAASSFAGDLDDVS